MVLLRLAPPDHSARPTAVLPLRQTVYLRDSNPGANSSGDELDLRFPFTGERLNEAFCRLETLYVELFGKRPDDSSFSLEDHRTFHHDVMAPLAAEAHVLAPATHEHHPRVTQMPPGIWRLDDAGRFPGTLLFFSADCFLDGYRKALVITLGPTPSLRLFSEWLEARVDELGRPSGKHAWSDAALPGSLADDIRQEVEDFLDGRALYGKYRLPWKKGLLFCGPPGNGKTHTIKILSSVYRLPTTTCVISDDLQEFESAARYDREGQPVPHMVVFEDIDRTFSEGRAGGSASMVPAFLNTLDGFSERQGCLVIATANEVEALDPAIRARPSRFDRIFEFPPPDRSARTGYLRRMLEEGGWPFERLAESTEGFSLAFLKELCLLCLQHVRRGGSAGEPTGLELVGRLRSHMTAGKRQIGLLSSSGKR